MKPEPRFSLSEYRKELKRDIIIHLVVLITVVSLTGIYICWQYGVEIDFYCTKLLK